MRQLDGLRAYYAPLHARNVAVDLARPDADLSAYRIVLAPHLYMVRPGVAENLERFVAGGGTLVMSFFSGIADERDHILLGGYPAPFRALLGLCVEEFDPYVPGQSNTLVTADGATYRCDLWSDVIDLEGAEAIATFAHDFYAGRPAVTRHRFGQGLAYYVGTRPEAAYLATLLGRVCNEAGVAPPLEAPRGVEVTRRLNENGSFLFLLNHNTAPTPLTLPRPGHDLLTDTPLAGTIVMEPYGVIVLKEG